MDVLLTLGAFLAGIGVHAAYNWQVERAAYAKYMREKGSRGNQKQQEISDRMGAAVAEAALMVKEGAKPLDIAKTLLPKYPDVALQLAKKLGKDGLEGLI